MNKSLLPFIALALFVCAVGIWFYTGPQRALRDIKSAANAGDVEGIRERVDVPAVKESLKEQLSAMVQQKFAVDAEMQSNPFAGMGMLFAGKMVETMVDNAVTPTRLVALIQGDRASAFDKDAPAASATETTSTESSDSKVELEGSYNSFDRYTMRVMNKETHEQVIALTMRRDGLSWRLTSIQLPTENKAIGDE